MDFWVDPNVPLMRGLLGLASRSPFVRAILGAIQPVGLVFARAFGGTNGIFAVEVEAADGRIVSQALFGSERTEQTAVIPAVLAARGLADGSFTERGLVRHDRQVDPAALFEALAKAGIETLRS